MSTSVGPEGTGASGSAPPQVRGGARHDAVDVARLHARYIPTGFLTLLGPRLLTRLYRRVVDSDDCFLLIADSNGMTVGFLAGSMSTRRLMRRFVLRDGPVVVLSTGWVVLRHWRQALETVFGGDSESPQADGGARQPVAGVEAELLAVAVDDGCRGQGVGSTLTRRFLDEAGRRGAGSARVVVGAANQEAIKLYERCGFETAKQFEHHRGATSLLMRRPLDPGHAPDHRCGPATPE